MYAKSWQNVREKSAKMSVTNWQKFFANKKKWQNVREKPALRPRKTAKMFAKESAKCP
jgi:hypothetical protein